MGAWGHKPWDNDTAADWFAGCFSGIDIDAKIDAAFKYRYDNYDEVRAACYILEVLGRTYVWPGKLDRLDDHLKKGLDLLRAMIDPENDESQMDFLELWGNDPEVIDSVKEQIKGLTQRLARK